MLFQRVVLSSFFVQNFNSIGQGVVKKIEFLFQKGPQIRIFGHIELFFDVVYNIALIV